MYTNSQAYFPEGYCISLLPTREDRMIHLSQGIKHVLAGHKNSHSHGLASVV